MIDKNSAFYSGGYKTHGQGFVGCIRGQLQIFQCKEEAAAYPVLDKLCFKMRLGTDVGLYIEQFKKLDGWIGLNTDVKVIENVNGNVMSLEGTWYNQNFLTQEMGRVLQKLCTCGYKSLDDLISNSKYAMTNPSHPTWDKAYFPRWKALMSDPVKVLGKLTEEQLKSILDKRPKSGAAGICWMLWNNYFDSVLNLPQGTPRYVQ